jgi:hypothetical protein
MFGKEAMSYHCHIILGRDSKVLIGKWRPQEKGIYCDPCVLQTLRELEPLRCLLRKLPVNTIGKKKAMCLDFPLFSFLRVSSLSRPLLLLVTHGTIG